MKSNYKIPFFFLLVYCIGLTYFATTNRVLIISNKNKIDSIAPVLNTVAPTVDSNKERSKRNEKSIDSILKFLNKSFGDRRAD